MGVIDSLYKRIEAGREGKNIGIPTGLPDLDKYTYGIQKGFMTTIFGDSGAGKTTYTLFTHVYKPLQFALENPNIPVKILYFSLEMSPEVLLAKLLSLFISDQFHVQISYKEILSLGGILDDDKFELICKAKAWLERVVQHLTIYDKAVNAVRVYNVVREWAGNFGTFMEEESMEIYVPKNPDMYKIVVIDHMRLLVGSDKKTEINTCADYLINLRDLCNLTVALVQQANRQIKSMDRRNSGYQYLQLDDMADASGPAQGSEVVIGIYYPHREKRTTCEGYDIKKLRDHARIIQILKHRYGVSDVMKGILFRGEIGYYKELPNPNDGALNYDEILDYNYLYMDKPLSDNNILDKLPPLDEEKDFTSTEDLFNDIDSSDGSSGLNFNFVFD